MANMLNTEEKVLVGNNGDNNVMVFHTGILLEFFQLI